MGRPMFVAAIATMFLALLALGGGPVACSGDGNPEPGCGDGECTADETCNTCPADCGACDPICGDGTCDTGETCGSCPQDCDPCGDWPGEVPQPWDGWDQLPANSELLTNTDGDDMSVTCTGSPGNPAGLTAEDLIVGTADGNVTITASYCIIHDIQFEGYQVRVDGDHYVIRDCDIDGAGRTSKNGLSLSGDMGVAYRVKSHHLLGNDRHCFTNGHGAMDMWFIECEGYYCTGDGYQAGHQADGNRPTNIYLVRNHLHDNRENGLDYKYVQNLFAVENTLHGFAAASSGETWCFPDDPAVCEDNLSSGSDGSAVVVGSDGAPIDTYHFRNTIHDSVKGIRVEAALGDIHIEGNVVHDLSGTCLALDKEGLGIEFIANTCRNAQRGIFQNWRVNFGLDVAGNTFENISGPAIEYEQGEVIDRSTLTDNAFIGTGPVIYNNDVATTEAEINALPGASGNTVSP